MTLSPIAPPPDVVVTLCTFNERENIERLIAAIREALPAAHILVVDDSSPDGTSDVVRQLSTVDRQVHLLVRRVKEGLGAATRAAFEAALAVNPRLIINLDADFSHPPEVLPQLVAALSAAPVAIGSRYVSGGRTVGWPWHRLVMSYCVNLICRWWLGLKPRDCSGAYRGYHTDLLRQVDWAGFHSMGYAFQEELLYRCVKLNATVAEIPITFTDRAKGQSKVNLREIVRSLFDLIFLPWRL